MSSWDVEELYGSSGKWTLESDKRVFLKLEEMSQRIADKLGKIDRTLFEIERQSEYNFVDLNNTFNRFLMLSDAQFIENRVYDEEDQVVTSNALDEFGSNSSNLENQDTGTNLISQYSLALQEGIRALKSFGSEESSSFEENQKSNALFSAYGLPLIIGTDEFTKFCSSKDLSNVDDPVLSSDEGTKVNDDHSPASPPSPPQMDSSSESRESVALFEDNKREDLFGGVGLSFATSNFNNQDRSVPSNGSNEFLPRPQTTQSNLFEALANLLDEKDISFEKSKEEEKSMERTEIDSLVNSNVAPTKSTRFSALFDDETEDLFTRSNPSSPARKRVSQFISPKEKNSSILFKSDSEDEVEKMQSMVKVKPTESSVLFRDENYTLDSQSQTESTTEGNVLRSSRNLEILFDPRNMLPADEKNAMQIYPEEDRKEVIAADVTKNSKNSDGISIKRLSNPKVFVKLLPDVEKSVEQSNSNEEDTGIQKSEKDENSGSDLFDPKIMSTYSEEQSNYSSNQEVDPLVTKRNIHVSVHQFESESTSYVNKDEEANFSNLQPGSDDTPDKKSSESESITATRKGLFDETDEENLDFPTSQKKEAAEFADIKSSSADALDKESVRSQVKSTAKKGLFDDSDEENFEFLKPKSESKEVSSTVHKRPQNSERVDLFGDDEDLDDFLLPQKSTVSQSGGKVRAVSDNKLPKVKSGLFGDDDDDFDPMLFKSGAPK